MKYTVKVQGRFDLGRTKTATIRCEANSLQQAEAKAVDEFVRLNPRCREAWPLKK